LCAPRSSKKSLDRTSKNYLRSQGHTIVCVVVRGGAVGVDMSKRKRKRGVAGGRHPKTHSWGPALVTYKAYKSKSHSWQGTCPLRASHRHGDGKETRCKKTLVIRPSDPFQTEAKVLARMHHWLNRCQEFGTRSAHLDYTPDAAPSNSVLEANRLPDDFVDPLYRPRRWCSYCSMALILGMHDVVIHGECVFRIWASIL
jgi:hypothetical protein